MNNLNKIQKNAKEERQISWVDKLTCTFYTLFLSSIKWGVFFLVFVNENPGK